MGFTYGPNEKPKKNGFLGYEQNNPGRNKDIHFYYKLGTTTTIEEV